MAPPPESPSPGRARPGRPSSGARERILEAALDVLKAEGYAGMTNAKVAARSGQNKALISYHFGSKAGLVAEVARAMSAAITEELLQGIGEPRDVRALARGVVDGVAAVMSRDAGLARLYFDLAAEDRVIHLMGRPDATRHLIVANGDAVLSPAWSIHMGSGTGPYAFVWGMTGENQAYSDVDPVPVARLR